MHVRFLSSQRAADYQSQEKNRNPAGDSRMGRVLTPRAAASDDDDDSKTSWPEVVGWLMLDASGKITSDRPDLSPAFYTDTDPLPTNYDPKRVIIIVHAVSGVVVKTPVVG